MSEHMFEGPGFGGILASIHARDEAEKDERRRQKINDSYVKMKDGREFQFDMDAAMKDNDSIHFPESVMLYLQKMMCVF